jgi:hypothetical protein
MVGIEKQAAMKARTKQSFFTDLSNLFLGFPGLAGLCAGLSHALAEAGHDARRICRLAAGSASANSGAVLAALCGHRAGR